MKAINAEVITIGDEILYGQITNTNAQFISTELDKIGVRVIRHSSVSDTEEAILGILAEAEQRADVIITTGGLGPTKDDITKKTIAKFFGTEMVINPEMLQHIEDFFLKRGRPMLEVNRMQAAVPENCTMLFNRLGTAPGMWFEWKGKVLVSMPGVPKEMEILMNEKVIPKVQEFFKTPIIYHKVVQTFGIGESMLADAIADWEDNLPEHLKLAYLPNWGQVRLRLTAFGDDLETLKKEVDEKIAEVLPRFEKYVFGYDKDELEEVVGRILVDQKKTISTAESCTGGYLSHLFTKIPGSSRYFVGGIVSYSNKAKVQQLNVHPATLEEHGAVSEATIKEMAMNVRKVMNTDIGIATSGIAGPDGGSDEKPVGTVWIAYADENEVYAKKLTLVKDRMLNIRMSATILMDLVRKKLLNIM